MLSVQRGQSELHTGIDRNAQNAPHGQKDGNEPDTPFDPFGECHEGKRSDFTIFHMPYPREGTKILAGSRRNKKVDLEKICS